MIENNGRQNVEPHHNPDASGDENYRRQPPIAARKQYLRETLYLFQDVAVWRFWYASPELAKGLLLKWDLSPIDLAANKPVMHRSLLLSSLPLT
jgi:hypothetical protein